MLSTGETYHDLAGDYSHQPRPQRQTRRLVAQLERLRHNVTLTEDAAQPERTFPLRTRSSPAGSRPECSLSRIAALVVGARGSWQGQDRSEVLAGAGGGFLFGPG